jgi:hypothetical protein
MTINWSVSRGTFYRFQFGIVWYCVGMRGREKGREREGGREASFSGLFDHFALSHATPSHTFHPEVPRAGDVEPPTIADWRALPYELEETILANLSLPKLARVSTTCKRFDHHFRQKLAKEQKACYDLAVARFGKERLACIAELVHGFLAQLYDPHTGRRQALLVE